MGQHHERYDGKGYPLHTSGPAISYAGRIVAVADAYEAMTSSRSYQSAVATAEARAELTRGAGSQFDPVVVRAFLSLSIGRLDRRTGPLAWLAHIPVIATAPLTHAATAVAVSTAALLAADTVALNPFSRGEQGLSIDAALIGEGLFETGRLLDEHTETSFPTGAYSSTAAPPLSVIPTSSVPISSVPISVIPTSSVPAPPPQPEAPSSPHTVPAPDTTAPSEAAPPDPGGNGGTSAPATVVLANAYVSRSGSLQLNVVQPSGSVSLLYLACDQGSSSFSGRGDPVTVSPQGASAAYTCEFQADRADGSVVRGTFTVIPT